MYNTTLHHCSIFWTNAARGSLGRDMFLRVRSYDTGDHRRNHRDQRVDGANLLRTVVDGRKENVSAVAMG